MESFILQPWRVNDHLGKIARPKFRIYYKNNFCFQKWSRTMDLVQPTLIVFTSARLLLLHCSVSNPSKSVKLSDKMSSGDRDSSFGIKNLPL